MHFSAQTTLGSKAQDLETLGLILSLKDLVKNSFLLTLSLEVLPRMVDRGQSISVIRVTRMALNDQFIDQWLERGKKRLGEKDLGDQVRSALCDEGFTLNGIDFSCRSFPWQSTRNKAAIQLLNATRRKSLSSEWGFELQDEQELSVTGNEQPLVDLISPLGGAS
ncbi:MAG: hypothetical protein J3Q66DRAFT_144160 [Benniella sp.]|nr:MAG: hypothetical protein J3Q66DRAFT_144160 [Benniella sp.]